MTQLFSIPLDPSMKERALARIGYFVTTKRKGRHVDSWAVLNWFVGLTNVDIAELSLIKLSQKQEEFRALQEEGIQHFNNTPPSREAFLQFQGRVNEQLSQLAESGSLTLGPFPIVLLIACGKSTQGLKHRIYSGEEYLPFRLPLQKESGVPKPEQGEGLLFLMGRCLQQNADLLKRCLYCDHLFLQRRRVLSPKREQLHCCHLHRTLASKRRATEQQAAAQLSKEKRAKINGTRRLKTKGRRHGQKRR